MSNERMKILEMVSEGKLTVEEASQLLDRVAQSEIIAEEDALVEGAAAETEEKALSEPNIWHWLKQLISSFGPKEKYEEDLDWVFDSAEIEAIAAQTTNGAVKFTGIETDQTDQVTVQARKVVKAPTLQAAEAFAQQVQILIEQEAGTLRIYKEHPKPPLGVEVSVSYQIESPSAVDLTLQTTNGKIQAERAAGAIKTTSTNGKIRLRAVAGHIHAQTTNGSIKADMTALKEGSDFATTNGSIQVDIQEGVAPISATTSNGSIKLTLPADFSGQLDARTVNGRIDVKTDFAATAIKKSFKNSFIGQIGPDERENPLKLRTVNGSIRLAAQV